MINNKNLRILITFALLSEPVAIYAGPVCSKHRVVVNTIQDQENESNKLHVQAQQNSSNRLGIATEFPQYKDLVKRCPRAQRLIAEFHGIFTPSYSNPLHRGVYPLHSAVYSEFDTDRAQILIALGADVNQRSANKNAYTPLSIALISTDRRKHKEKALMLGYLLDYRADANTISDSIDGWTIVHEAVSYTNVPAVRLLIERGFDLNCKFKGLTPLDLARREQAEYGHFESNKKIMQDMVTILDRAMKEPPVLR